MTKPMSTGTKIAIVGGVLGGVAGVCILLAGKALTAPSGDGAGGGVAPPAPSGGESSGGGGESSGVWASASSSSPWANAMWGSDMPLANVRSVWAHAPSDAIQGLAIAMPYYTEASLTASEEPYGPNTIQSFAGIGQFIRDHGASQVITDADVAIFWLSHDDAFNWAFGGTPETRAEQLNAIRSALSAQTMMVLVLDRVPSGVLYDVHEKLQEQVPGPWQLVDMPIDASKEAGERLVAALAGDAKALNTPWAPPAVEEKKKPWYWPF